MAFEIYNGTLSSSVNEIIDKLAEMWDFDSTDLESSSHSVTYGNAMLFQNNALWQLALYKTENGADTMIDYYTTASGRRYSIVAASDAVLISMESSNGSFATYIIGDLTNVDGTTGKGGLIVGDNDSASWYSVMGTTIEQPGATETFRTSTEMSQLIPYVSSATGYYFDNAYRLTVGTTYRNRGVYTIGDNRYYISQRTAIKEE